MFYLCDIENIYKFCGIIHEICKKTNKRTVYNQLFIDDKLYILNIKTGELYVNQIDLDMVLILKRYNFSISTDDRFITRVNTEKVLIHQIIFNTKTNRNWVINHIDGDPSNNKRINLELVSQWFNSVLVNKTSGLPIGIQYNNGGNSFVVQIRSPITRQHIIFGSQSIDYLQNIHYQFGTKSGLVKPQRYLQAVPNWLPNDTIQFTSKHQDKLDILIEAHIKNQTKWDNIKFNEMVEIKR